MGLESGRGLGLGLRLALVILFSNIPHLRFTMRLEYIDGVCVLC